MTPTGLQIARQDAVATITLNRPELLNRFDDQLHLALTDALQTLNADGQIRAVVLASTGKVFSAGGDFELMTNAQSDAVTRARIVENARQLLHALLGLRQPIVVAVQGAAIGLGATVVLSCDAVVAARSAQLADSHVNVGLVAGDGGCLVWPATAGIIRARRHLLTGDPLSAVDAHALGLVTDLVDQPEDALPAATAIAERIAALPPLAVQLTKRVLNRALAQRAGEILDLSLAYEERTLGSDDLLEGIAAIKERRPGHFIGR